jgi:murein DD-endopeptidase MepM/ murein hydrolase activator NlpD
VIFAGPAQVYGDTVVIDHGGSYQTLYAHLSRIDVTVGQRVAMLQQVGLCGQTGDATGPHLHFEVRYDGYVWDPLSFLP